MADRVPDSARATPGARQGRQVAIVIALATALWLLGQEIGRQYGWPGQYALLMDLAAMAAYLWALIVTYRLWRGRKASDRAS